MRGADIAILFHRQFRGCEYSLARCQTCGQHFCHPIPTEEELATFYAGDFHQELRTGGEIEQVFAAKFMGYRDWVLEFVRGGRSLDIGTATGLLPALLKQVGFDAEGIEYNEASAKWGEEHYGVRTVPAISSSTTPSWAYRPHFDDRRIGSHSPST